MTNFYLIYLFFTSFFIPQFMMTEYPPVVPLTNALTTIYCHNDNEFGMMNIRCGLNEKIRMLDAYDVVVKNKSHLPLQCLRPKDFALIHDDQPIRADCQMPTSFTSACSGRENCTVHMQQKRLISAIDHCHDELVDYTMAFFECISDVFIHDVCSTQAITSTWGTLKTPNFPNPYTSNDDCWCKLSTQLEHQLLLSVIVFQLIPYDQQCTGAGLYLQGSDTQRSTQCTYLQQGYKYLSQANSLYINFYSRTSTVRGGFWIVYEANHPYAEVHLHCGSRDKIGAPSMNPSLSVYNHGWSRSVYPNPPDTIPTTNDQMMHLLATTPRSLLDRDFKISTPTTVAAAFTYPYGRLTTFELDYGPKGWFLKYLFGSSNVTATRFIQTTTSQWPIVKWNSTWRYFRRPRPRIFTTRTTTSTTASTILQTETTLISTTLTTKQHTTTISSTTSSTSTTSDTSTRKPELSNTTDSMESSTTITTTTSLSRASSTAKTTLPLPTPWYPPAGPFDWWHWKWHTTKAMKLLSTISNTTQTSATTTTTKDTTTSPTIVTNKTTITTPIQENATTGDWFEWPHLEFTSTVKGRTDYDEEEEYSEWPDYFATAKIPSEQTTNSLLFFPPERSRKKLQQMNFFPTKFNPQFMNSLLTKPTPPPFSMYSTPQFTDQLPKSQSPVTDVHTHQNGVQQLVEQENKKTPEENGWFNKTDLTIVGVSILFVILLVLTNLIIFAVRRHRHQIQGQHLFSASSIHSRRIAPKDHPFQNGPPINSFNTTNNNNNDILPAVGEIVLWDNKDQGGYTIDNRGEWEKIDGRQWFGNNILKNCARTSFSKSFRSRFQFIRQSNKKPPHRPQQLSPKILQQVSKYPLLMDTASLSPVPEVDDYRLSDLSSERAGQTSVFVHKEHDHSDEYYKRIETCGSESNYTTLHGTVQGEYSLGDQQTDRSLGNENDAGESVIISVPTMFRQEDDLGTISDAGESIYNANYSIHSFERNRNVNRHFNYPSKSPRNNTIIIGHCQAEFPSLDPQLFSKTTDKSLLADHQQFYTYSHSVEFSAYDSGFFDDQTTFDSDHSEKATNDQPIELNDLTITNPRQLHR